MATVNQLIKKSRKPKVKKTDVPALNSCPQRRGVCTRVYTSCFGKVVRVESDQVSLPVCPNAKPSLPYVRTQ